jgi:Na+/H+ antiporter NhaD/arsenite permease-like protein
VTAVASALLDNVTTVLLVAPVTMTVCRQLNLPSGPYLIVLAFASNIGGTATLIGDPPNIIIASRAKLTFADFLVHLSPIVVLLLVAFTGLCWLLFGRRLDRLRAGMPTPPQQRAVEAITDRRLLARCLVILLAVMLGFVLHSALHLDPSMIAMLSAGAMVLTARVRPQQFLEEVEWATLVFFMGLFVLVGGLVRVGVIDMLGHAATEAMGERYLLAASALLFGSAVLGAVVDNIPYTTAMAPIVEDLVASVPDREQGRALWWAFALGADLGGNTTAVAAGANVVVVGLAARHHEPISFWQFTRYGLLVTAVTLLLAWPYVWLRYFRALDHMSVDRRVHRMKRRDKDALDRDQMPAAFGGPAARTASPRLLGLTAIRQFTTRPRTIMAMPRSR